MRGGIGIFTGPPLYVWISNQLGNTGVLQGSLLEDFPTARPFHPDIDSLPAGQRHRRAGGEL